MTTFARHVRRIARGLDGSPDRARGIALVAVLWIITALTVLILSFNASVRSHLDVSSSEFGIARAQAVIDGGVRLAVFKLRATNETQRWASDGRAYNVDIAGSAVRISIQDTRGLIDLNAAPVKLLESYVAGRLNDTIAARALAARIADWGDADHKVRDGGAEDGAYSAAGRPHGAGDQPFADPIELRSVLGITPVTAEALAPHLTIYNGTPTINVMTAPRAVLAALPGITAGTVANVLALRAKKPDREALLATLSQWQIYIMAQSGPAYSIRIDVTDKTITAAAAEVTVLLHDGGKKPFHILDWRELRPQSR